MTERSRNAGDAEVGDSSTPAPGAEAAPASASDRSRIERILAQTLMAADEDSLTAAERAALQDVAARRAGEPLTLDPVTVDMVAALLGIAFNVQVERSTMCMEMSRTIAASLWQDVVVRERLGDLWRQLLESR